MVSLSASIECLCRGNFAAALLMANASVSFPSLGDYHRLPCHSNVKSEFAAASATSVLQPWSSPATSTHRVCLPTPLSTARNRPSQPKASGDGDNDSG